MTLARRIVPCSSDRTTAAAPDLLARLLAQRPPAGHGRAQCDAGFLFRRRPLPRSRGGDRASPPHGRRKAPTLLDIGAESTRPMAMPWTSRSTKSCARLAPVLPAVVALGVPVSIDTIKAKVAAAALAAGAAIVNDVWGLQRDPDMARRRRRRTRVPVVLMHNRDRRRSGDRHHGRHQRLLRPLARHRASAPASRASGSCSIPASASARRRSRASSPSRRCASSSRFGLPLLVGASRKRFIDKVSPAPPDRRLGGSIAAHLAAVGGRRRHHPRARRRRDRAGAARRRRHPERPMSRRACSSPGLRCTPITA